jgi:hypothetical protein
MIHQALEVAGGHRAESRAAQVAEQRHRDAGFVTIAVRVDHAGDVRLGLEQRSEERIQLRVEQHHVFSAVDRPGHDGRGVFDGPGNFEHEVDRVSLAHDGGVVGNRELPSACRLVECQGR